MKRESYIPKQANQFDRFIYGFMKLFAWFMLFQILRAIANGWI